MFSDKIEAKDFFKMPKEYQDLLVRVLQIQADCEIGGPHLYVNEWMLARVKRRRTMEGREDGDGGD